MKNKNCSWCIYFCLFLFVVNWNNAVAVESDYTLPRPEISAAFPYESRFIDVLDKNMHYVETGQGNPVLFIHGNPTYSYLWRNIMPYVSGSGRAIA